ncbi:MAG TPA: hypothetical protein VFO55_14130 [Gemmatimonadaceae bacterium]|nr:hypothetical protein [Gemmatimonadaceae bacterium]
MTTPVHPAPSTTSFGSRLLFGALGLIALGIGTLITLGAALVGVIAILVARYLLARRGKGLSRRGAWLASVGATVLVLVVPMGLMVLLDDSLSRRMTASERAEQRARAEEVMPEWMRKMNPNAGQRTAAADSVAEKLLQNTTVVIWAGLMGTVIASTMIGTIAGSFAWGGVMLLYRGWQGRWLGSQPGPSAGLA